MSIRSIQPTSSLNSEQDVINFYKNAITYRYKHKKESEIIAQHVFDATHASKISFIAPDDLVKIRYEFGALEAPGQPEAHQDTDEFIDNLWARLAKMVKTAQELRTV